jgi:hypothetical protein
MSNVKFLRGEYFRDNDRFIRFQDVPEKYHHAVKARFETIRKLSRTGVSEHPNATAQRGCG